MKVLIALIAGLVAVNAQFTPQQKPTCNPDEVIAGSKVFLPHEKYCQLYYHCNLQKAFTKTCGRNMFFNFGLLTCLTPNDLNAPVGTVCPQWTCNGNKYPDLCCNKYWQCENNIFVQRSCQQNTVFDMAIGQCVNNPNVCVNSKFCDQNRVTSVAYKCPMGVVQNDKCSYTYTGVIGKLPCPLGTEFNLEKCAFVHSQDCDASRINYALNKALDPNCKASYITQFSTNLLSVDSEKITVNPQFKGSLYSEANVQNGAAILPANAGRELYSNYYKFNPIMVPMAMEIIFKVDSNAQQTFDLITNIPPNHLNVPLLECPPTFSVKVTPSFSQWTFNIKASSGVTNNQETMSFTVNAPNNQNYYKFVMGFQGGILKAAVYNAGFNGDGSGVSNNQNLIGSKVGTVDLGTEIKATKCGLTIGHNMAGAIKKWAMYEGCMNPNRITGL